MVLAVDVGRLVHVTVLLGAAEDLERFLGRDVVRTTGLDRVVGHVADLDAPVVLIIRAALAKLGPRVAAGADACGDVAFILLQPVRDLLDIERLAVHADFLFDRDDVHADAVAARADHRGDVLQRQEGHSFKERSDRRVGVDSVLGRVEQLRAAGDEE